MVKAPKSSHITPILRSLHWLKINERIEYKFLSLTYKVHTTSQPDYLHNLISVQSTGRTRSSSTLARPSVSSTFFLITNNQPATALLHMHHLTCGISSLLHSVNLILFTVSLAHLILRITSSHHLRSHHISLPLPFTPDLKLISFTNPFLHRPSHSYSFRTDFTDLNLYRIKGALFVLVSGYVC